MALEVRWTSEASTQLSEILKYLENNWTDREVRSFFKMLEEGTSVISTNPYQQKKSPRKDGTREYQITTQITLFYSFDESTVVILLLWSNRMNPDKL